MSFVFGRSDRLSAAFALSIEGAGILFENGIKNTRRHLFITIRVHKCDGTGVVRESLLGV